MGQVNKTKLAIICKFSDAEFRSRLKLKSNRKIFNLLIKLFGFPARVGECRDHSPWTINIIKELERRDDFETHIVSEHVALSPNIQEFDYKGIHYHMYNSDLSNFWRKFDNLKIWKILQRNSYYICKFITKINPDLIVIIGIEYPPTGISALCIKNKPLFVLSQTIYSNPEICIHGKYHKLNWDLEVEIHKKLTYFGVYSRMHYNLLLKNNPNAMIFDFVWPSGKFPTVNELVKEFDFVHFSNEIGELKGSFDTLKALAIVKKQRPDVILNITGGCDDTTKKKLLQLMNQLNITNNVIFTPFFVERKNLFQHIKKSRFAILPCYLDFISGTMLQAMYYELPIIVYKTSGTPLFNKKKECALISDIGDIESLARSMLFLLEDPNKVTQITTNAKEFVSTYIKNNNTFDRLANDFTAIINNYYSGIDIPKEFLFDTKTNCNEQ